MEESLIVNFLTWKHLALSSVTERGSASPRLLDGGFVDKEANLVDEVVTESTSGSEESTLTDVERNSGAGKNI